MHTHIDTVEVGTWDNLLISMKHTSLLRAIRTSCSTTSLFSGPHDEEGVQSSNSDNGKINLKPQTQNLLSDVPESLPDDERVGGWARCFLPAF